MTLVVVGISPFVDTSIACGPFRSRDRASEVSEELTLKGYNTEVIELMASADVETAVNEEGSDEV
jgi:hypothetical protein